MRNGFILVATGVLLGALAQNHFSEVGVHAQDQQQMFGPLGGCTTAVPKEWGDFRGASTYGLAFEDANGTVRFVQRPACNTSNSTANLPVSVPDLQIERR